MPYYVLYVIDCCPCIRPTVRNAVVVHVYIRLVYGNIYRTSPTLGSPSQKALFSASNAGSLQSGGRVFTRWRLVIYVTPKM